MENMIKKRVKIEFISDEINAIDAFDDIDDAVIYTQCRPIYLRGAEVERPIITKDGDVVLEIYIPERKIGYYNIGDYLCFIRDYLLTRTDTNYNKYLIDGHLLYLQKMLVLPKYETVDQLNAISKFVKLLRRTDHESMKGINKILDILDEYV